nr:pre-mRNA-splicing factor CWC22-like [Ipomoea batatas]
MGNCCVSSATKEPPQNSERETLPPHHPLPEEETVKEVLSETPTVRKNPPPVPANGSHPPKNSPPAVDKRRENGRKPSAGRMVFRSDGISGDIFAPEICKRDHGDDVIEARRRSPPARVQKRSVSDKNGVGRSPSRRFEPSPGRARSSPGRDPGQGSPGNVSRMDNGQISGGLRSRSPIMHADNGNARTGSGRSPSARKTGRSLERVRSELGDKSRRLEESYSNRDSREKWPPTYSNESLENPLVSLECFIFL